LTKPNFNKKVGVSNSENVDASVALADPLKSCQKSGNSGVTGAKSLTVIIHKPEPMVQ
jgi:hypothetical protein